MKHSPLSQQRTALDRARGQPYFAFFMEQGTGKSYVTLAEAEELFIEGKLDLLIVVAPNGVQLNWLRRQAPKHLSVSFKTLLWSPNHTLKYKREVTAFINSASLEQGLMAGKTLHILAFNVEAFSATRSKAEIFLRAVLKRFGARALFVIDESSVIKNLTTALTRHLISIGEQQPVPIKRLLTGTPATQSPFNFFAQAKFLRRGLICGYTEFTPFKQYFGEWVQKFGRDSRAAKAGNPHKTIQYPSLVRYRNLGILKAEVDKFSYTVTKKECLDLPAQNWELRDVEMTQQQAGLYDRAVADFIIWLGDEKVTIAHALTRLTRLCQITGGFIKFDEDKEATAIPGGNPKVASLLQYVEEMPVGKKLVVWARYTAELRAIADALGPKNCALYWGEIDGTERHENIDRFMAADGARFFVGNPQSGKFGIELFAASHVLYYSNSFSADARWQSEDRVHRIGQTEPVLYTDLVCEGTVDHKILAILQQHTSLATFFKGDKVAMSKWIQEDDDVE